MPTLTTHPDPSGASVSTLLVALDLGNTSWSLACAPAISEAPRVRVFPARTLPRLFTELATARQHFGLAPDAPVVFCYEAGRDGFRLQRACSAAGLTALVVDSSSIEVSRRARRAKTDRLDATALLRLLFRHVAGERGHWRVQHVPRVDEEDRRHPHRELGRLTRERTRAVNQIKGCLAAHGIVLAATLRDLPGQMDCLTQWDGQPLPGGVREPLLTTWARLILVQQQRTALVKARRVQLEQSADPAVAMVRQLLRLRGAGEVSAWLFTMELFSWRRFRNQREVAGVLGLTATPQMSGVRRRELGIGEGGSAVWRGVAETCTALSSTNLASAPLSRATNAAFQRRRASRTLASLSVGARCRRWDTHPDATTIMRPIAAIFRTGLGPRRSDLKGRSNASRFCCGASKKLRQTSGSSQPLPESAPAVASAR